MRDHDWRLIVLYILFYGTESGRNCNHKQKKKKKYFQNLWVLQHLTLPAYRGIMVQVRSHSRKSHKPAVDGSVAMRDFPHIGYSHTSAVCCLSLCVGLLSNSHNFSLCHRHNIIHTWSYICILVLLILSFFIFIFSFNFRCHFCHILWLQSSE